MTSTSLRICAAGLAASLVLGSAFSADAAPPFASGDASNIVKVQAGGGDMGGGDARSRYDRRWGGSSNYNRYDGYRGGRDWRDHDYHGNDGAAAAAALLGGLLLGGAIANSARPPAPYPNPHVDWCLANMPGYDPYDNTYQAYGGARMICRSPFGG